MRSTLPPVLSVIASCIGHAAADSYANNQNAVVVDSPQVAANFPDIEGVELLSPAFFSNASLPPTWVNGTSGPTPQSTLGMLDSRLCSLL